MTDPARAGSSLASVPDDELDAYIADLILQKSKTKEIRSHHEGIAAYLEDDANAAKAPNTNKRFLTSMVRNVEGHNQALLRQQAREERSQSAGARRRGQDAVAGPSRLRRWSDDEEEGNDGSSPLRAAQNQDGEGQEEFGLSSKMDRYFAETTDEPPSDQQSASLSERAQEKERKESDRRSHPHARNSRHASSESKSSRHRVRSPHDSRRDSSKRSRDDWPDRSGEERGHRSGLTQKSNERRRSHRSTPKERDDGSDDERKIRRRKESSKHRNRESSHRDRRNAARERSASPPTQPSKVREWDLGKGSLAF